MILFGTALSKSSEYLNKFFINKTKEMYLKGSLYVSKHTNGIYSKKQKVAK